MNYFKTAEKLILITIFFIILTGILTYPFIFKINTAIAGWHSTDEPFAALWGSWWYRYAFRHNLDESFYSVIAVPYGLNNGGKGAYPAWSFLYKWSSILTNEVLPFNIQIILSFILSGISMYYLAFYLTGKNIPSLFGAIIYAFCPYHFARAWQHLGLAQIQWMPLYLLTLIRLKDRLNLKNLFLCMITISLVNSFELHYAIFMCMGTALFLLYCCIFHKKIDWKLFIAVFIVMAIGIAVVLSTPVLDSLKKMIFEKSTINPSVWSLVRPFEDLFSQSARPLSYFLPAISHPVLGKFTEYFAGSSLYGISLTEHTLYLGAVSLALAFIAFKEWRKRRKGIKLKRAPSGQAHYNREHFYLGFFLLLAITSWLFSQPPWWAIGPLKIYMPSFFMYKIIPSIRAYCRFGIVVMLAVAVLSGFGLKFITDRFKRRIARVSVTILFSILALFEFWNYPPFKVIDVSEVPAVYNWLKEEPGDFAIAEYPLDINGADLMYLFYQTKHEKKMINATVPQTVANRLANTIVKLSSPDTARILKWMGVKYVLIHKAGYLNTDLLENKEELEKISRSPALKLIGSFLEQGCPQKDIICTRKTGPVDIYEITASPIKPRVQ